MGDLAEPIKGCLEAKGHFGQNLGGWGVGWEGRMTTDKAWTSPWKRAGAFREQ